MCTKMLKNLSEKCRAKAPATTRGCLNNAFSEVFEPEASPVEGQTYHCSKKITKGEKAKAKKD